MFLVGVVVVAVFIKKMLFKEIFRGHMTEVMDNHDVTSSF